MTDVPPGNGLMARMAVLEAKVRLLSAFMKGLLVAFITALIAYFFKGT